jgi:hypothetical protein
VERAAKSTALIAEAGMSARRLSVPLTMQDFPRDPAIHGGGEHDDPMHASTRHIGLATSCWREKKGLPPLDVPGCLETAGVPMPPLGKREACTKFEGKGDAEEHRRCDGRVVELDSTCHSGKVFGSISPIKE